MSPGYRHVMYVLAIAALFGVVHSRAVNISNTWMLPEEGFAVFYRYFRDRISWYEADAVCQFHHANLVTADSSSQYDAIRAYLKELDITEKVWIGLSKPQEKNLFLWTDYSPLSGDGHWQESLPAGDSQSLCTVMDPAVDFLWRALPCGGPEVAAFICELPIPSWALGPKGCLLTELPSLTVLYMPEQSALELTSDCGLDGTKRIACKGNADHEEMLRQLTCVIPNEDMEEDKSTRTSTSDYYETSTWDEEGSIANKTSKSWTLNTINPDYGMPTRHRRETEDSLSPTATTESSFGEAPKTNSSWQETHRENTVLTTQQVASAEDQLLTSTSIPSTSFEADPNNANSTIVVSIATTSADEGTFETLASSSTTEQALFTTTPARAIENSTQTNKNGMGNVLLHEGSGEDYPSAISQGHMFSIIDNGTMFDIIELNETEQDVKGTKPNQPSSSTTMTWLTPMASAAEATTDSPTKLPVPTKKLYTKKPVQPTKKSPQTKNKQLATQSPTTTKQPQSVDEIEENLTKEFEMMPDIKDTSDKLNRTFRKELPPINDADDHTILEAGSQYGVPRILNFTITNALELDEDGLQQDQPQEDANVTQSSEDLHTQATPSVVKKNEPKLDDDDGDDITTVVIDDKPNNNTADEVVKKKPEVTERVSPATTSTAAPPIQNVMDPRIYILNHHSTHPRNNQSETINPKVEAGHFLPTALLGEKPMSTDPSATEGYTEHPFPSDEPKKINRHRSIHSSTARKLYPYFFSRMLG